jgi:prepilin-type N-terminal cleavage/methylation domain-containing protein
MKHPSLPTRLLLKSSHSPQKSGFTLIEVLVVVLIIAIMASIITPSFLAWANNQRVGSAKSQIADAIRKTQNEAKRTKTDREIRFDNNGGNPRYAITSMDNTGAPKALTAITNWQSLAGEGSAKKGLQLKVSTAGGLSSESAGIVFNPYGAVVTGGSTALFDNAKNTTAPSVFTVQVSMGGGTHKRCILVKTLLGATREEKGGKCTL